MGVSLNPSTILSGQGINVSSVVSQIISEQSGQLSVWQGQQTTLATQEGLLEGEENNLTSLQTAVAALADPTGALAAQAATSSDTSVLTASAGITAVTATHSVVVNNLATTGTLYTDPVAAGPNASILANGETTGDIQLQVGGSGNTPFDIPITQGSNDTLTTLAAYINTQSTANNWGVTASVVSDTSGSRLALFSQSSGTAGALAITANTTTGAANTANTEDLASADTSILPHRPIHRNHSTATRRVRRHHRKPRHHCRQQRYAQYPGQLHQYPEHRQQLGSDRHRRQRCRRIPSLHFQLYLRNTGRRGLRHQHHQPHSYRQPELRFPRRRHQRFPHHRRRALQQQQQRL